MDDRGWDKIQIKNLEVFARHGVLPEENRLGQKFQVNATLYLSTREAGLKDDLKKTIHYGEVSRFITNYMTGHTFRLIEAAAEQMEGQREREPYSSEGIGMGMTGQRW